MHPASMYALRFSVLLVSMTFSINFDVPFIEGRRRSSARVQITTQHFIKTVEAKTSIISDAGHKPSPCLRPDSNWLPCVPNSSSLATLEN